MKKYLLASIACYIAILAILLLTKSDYFSKKKEKQNAEVVLKQSDLNEISINSKDSTLLMNGKETLVKFSFDDSLKIFKPESKEIWHKQLKRVMGIGFFENDSLALENYLENELSKLNLTNQLAQNDTVSTFHKLIHVLVNQNVLVIKKKLISASRQADGEESFVDLSDVGVTFAILLLSVFNIVLVFFPEKRKKVSLKIETVEVVKEKEHIVEIIPEILANYSFHFIEKYGNIYEKIENLSSNPTESEKAEIYKLLVEMSIHAHSYHLIGRQNQWKSLALSPNAQLILGKEVGESKLKEFTVHPEKTDRKFRYFVKLLSSLNVNSLDAFLRDEIRVQKKDLTD